MNYLEHDFFYFLWKAGAESGKATSDVTIRLKRKCFYRLFE